MVLGLFSGFGVSAEKLIKDDFPSYFEPQQGSCPPGHPKHTLAHSRDDLEP
jgi:hypothetical protein